jgi:hypothetical protein
MSSPSVNIQPPSADMKKLFVLKPFDEEHPVIEIAGEIARGGDRLQLSYKLTGNLTEINLPGLTAMAQRRNELWQHSCFEFFLGVQGEPGYWEFNLSPNGDWNVYRLSGYREGLTPELTYGALPFNVIVAESFCALELDLDLSQIVAADQAIEVGITTVIEEQAESKTGTGRISYWAIAHTGPEPDFHRRDSFTLQLPGV